MYLKFHTVVFDTKPHKANKNQRKKKKKKAEHFFDKRKRRKFAKTRFTANEFLTQTS